MMNIVFLVTGLLFILLLLIIVFSKKSIKSLENKYFKILSGINFVGYIVELCLQFSIRYIGKDAIISDIVGRLYLSYFFVWFGVFSIYTFVIALNKNDINRYNKEIDFVRKVMLIPIVIGLFLAFSLEQKIFFDGLNMYSYGMAVDFVKYGVFVYVTVWMILLVKNIKRLKEKKYYPIFLVITMLFVNGIIQTFDPSILIATMVGTFACYTMYFTIENPDLKMLNELYKNRELMEAIYEDKYNFLFEMTQEARNPVKDINLLCNEIKNSKKMADVKDNVDKLSSISRQLDFSINNVLNISSMDIQKIKIVNTKYDVLKLCDGIGIAIKDEVPESVKLNIELPKQVPTLYGDYMKLRQILYSLLNNACKKTANGSITLKLNTIEKYDICRLIFNISDTGPGMSLDVINDILGSTGELNKEELKDLENKECNIVVCKKIARLMGGNLMIKSTVGQGTDVVLTLDQRVYHDDDTILNQYKNELSNSKRVLVVSQDKRLINSIKNRLSEKSVITSVLYYGGDAVDKIKSGKKFDFILVDDEMNEMSGFDTFKAIKEIDEKTPIIIMLKEDKERLKKHYLDDGFDNCLLISNLNSELNELVDKY